MALHGQDISKLRHHIPPNVPRDLSPEVRDYLDSLVDFLREVVSEFSREGIKSPLRSGSVVIGAPDSAPADAMLDSSSVAMSLDEVGHNLKIKVKYSDGATVKTATIAVV